MAQALIKVYDRALTSLLGPAGYSRFARGLYAQSRDGVVWRGLWVILDSTGTGVLAQPHAAAYCPLASAVMEEGLSRLYGKAVRDRTAKLGQPFIIQPVYESMRRQFGEEREPFSYRVEDDLQINGKG